MEEASLGIHVTSAPTLTPLVDVAAQWITDAIQDPFDFPVLCVDDAGTRRWLTYQWAERFGARPEGADGICAGLAWTSLPQWLHMQSAQRPFRQSELALEILQAADEPEAAVWAQESGLRASSHRFWRAWRIAGLLDRYREHRPDLLQAWDAGHNVGDSASERWQAAVWRSLRAHAPQTPEKQPAKVLLIAPRSLTLARAEQLRELARTQRIDVLLTTPADCTHPASHVWGRQARAHFEAWLDLAQTHTVIEGSPSRRHLLGRLQTALRTGAEESGPSDRSVRWWGSHGVTRQVEVLRDKLTELFDEIPDLLPSDVVIRSPRPHLYAARLRSLFSPTIDGDQHPGRRLRLDVVDPRGASDNSVLRALGHLLDLSTSRCTASEVLGLLREEAVAPAFALSDDELDRAEELVEDAGIRWGLHGEHTQHFGFTSGAHTWKAGMDRLVAGIAVSANEQLFVGDTAPVDDVTDQDAHTVGQLLLFVETVTSLIEDPTPRSAADWLVWCRQAIESLCRPPHDVGWHLPAALALLADAASDDVVGPDLTLSDLRLRLEPLFREPAGRPRFGSGAILVCGPDHLRQVPHRVTIVVGVDEGDFPSTPLLDGDDLLQCGERRPLDPWAPDEDRQFLLDALNATTDVFAVLYAAREDFTGGPRPLARPLAVLQESAARLAEGELDASVAGLQPYSLGAQETFDPAAYRGAQALAAPHRPPVDVFTAGLTSSPTPSVSLERLTRFLLHPATALLTEQGGMTRQLPDVRPDEISVELDGLSRWKVGDRLLRASLSGLDVDAAVRAELAAGTLPPTRQAIATIEKVGDEVRALTARYRQVQAGAQPLRRYPLDVIADGTHFTGAVDVVGDDIVDVTFSSASPRALIRGWVKLLALTTADPQRRWRWVMMGSRGTTFLGPLPNPTWGEAVLSNLLDLFRIGTSEPVPLPLQLGHLYATRGRHFGRDSDALERLCRDEWKKSVENDPDWRAFYPTFEALWQAVPRPSDSTTISDEPRRLGVLARRLWQPLLAAGGK